MKSLNGIFITPSEDELARIWTAVSAHGFVADSTGVLKLLMLAVDAPREEEIEEEPPPPNFERVATYLMDNPEQVAKAVDAGKKALGAFLQRIKKGTP